MISVPKVRMVYSFTACLIRIENPHLYKYVSILEVLSRKSNCFLFSLPYKKSFMQLIHYCSLSSTRFDSKRQKVRQQKHGNYIIPATTWQQVNFESKIGLGIITITGCFSGRSKIGNCQQSYGLPSVANGLSHGLKIARPLSIFTPVCGLVPPFQVLVTRRKVRQQKLSDFSGRGTRT